MSGSNSVMVDELRAVADALAVAVEGGGNGDWMTVELALVEVQERTGRLLKEIAALEPDLG